MITLVGSGNVATWMARRLSQSARFPITQVFSRKLENARRLADTLHAEAIADIKLLNPDNQFFIFALADSAYDEILPQIPFKMPAAFMTSERSSVIIGIPASSATSMSARFLRWSPSAP